MARWRPTSKEAPVDANGNRPESPGQAIERILSEKGWTHEDLAVAIGRHRPLVTSLISGKRGITPELAVRLARALGNTAEYWVRLEGTRQLSLIPDDAEDVTQLSKLIDLAPIN